VGRNRATLGAAIDAGAEVIAALLTPSFAVLIGAGIRFANPPPGPISNQS
jgi:hypothetical protein